MDWLLSGTMGWILTALIFLGFGGALWWQRRKKANKVSKHWPPIGIDGFANVNIPKFYPLMEGQPTEELEPLSFEVAKMEANLLHSSQKRVWEKAIGIYNVTPNTNEAFAQPAQGWCVDEIGITSDPDAMPEGHPFVAWSMPHGPIILLFQWEMYYWFAHEVHNVFRYLLHGPLHIYNSVDTEDMDRSLELQKWITSEFSPRKDDE